MKYLNIKQFDVANGPGMRTSLFVTGCRHKCPGCFNLIAQNFEIGEEFTDETIDFLIESIRPEYMDGLTLLGGEPMDPLNQPSIHKLIMRVREEFGDSKTIWSWTGYVYPRDFERDSNKARAYTEYTDDILNNLDVLVDGPFIQSLKSAKLQFRGSANQEIIDMRKSRETGTKVVIQMDDDPNLVKEIYENSKKAKI